MRKTVLLMASMALALVLVSGVAWAVTKTCKANADWCVGTNDRDLLIGSDEKDKIYGLDANDTLRGKGGDDNLFGGEGEDTIEGGEGRDYITRQDTGADKINGGDGGDYLEDASYSCTPSDCVDDRNLIVGGNGEDYIYGHNRLQGGPGDDHIYGAYVYKNGVTREITGGDGTDRIRSGGVANDTIRVRDNEHDVVSCGGGTDKVFFDKGIDSVHPLNCEERIGG